MSDFMPVPEPAYTDRQGTPNGQRSEATRRVRHIHTSLSTLLWVTWSGLLLPAESYICMMAPLRLLLVQIACDMRACINMRVRTLRANECCAVRDRGPRRCRY